MPEPLACPQCGDELPRGGPHRLCLQCLLKAGNTGSGIVGDSDAPLPATLPVPADAAADGSLDGQARCGDESEQTDPLEPGTRFRYVGDHELLQEIARGGMGVVYKARQVCLVGGGAVTLILSGLLARDDDVRRFRREAATENAEHGRP